MIIFTSIIFAFFWHYIYPKFYLASLISSISSVFFAWILLLPHSAFFNKDMVYDLATAFLFSFIFSMAIGWLVLVIKKK